MPQKIKILISAYACSPNKGSEPGMGWNFVSGLSKYYEVHAIVEKLKWEKPIIEYLKKNPELNKNLNFYFIEKKRNKKLRKIWPPSYYWYYRKWQLEAFTLAKKLNEKENFKLVHQLNMVGYREPGFLWKLDKPFVWGPIGGLENSPLNFIFGLGFKGFLFYLSRNIINSYQRRFKIRPRKAINHKKSKLISATPATADIIKKLWKRESEIICEVGQEITKSIIHSKRAVNDPLRIIWSGIHTARKNLPLLLNALKDINFNYELHILGYGECTKKWKKLAIKNNVMKNCKWYGWLEKEKAIDIMQKGHVLCITSISDLTSTVTIEGLSFGLPIVCLNHLGFGYVVDNSCGIKVPVTSPKQACKGFQNALFKIYNNEGLRIKLSKGALKRSQDFSWNNKIKRLNTIYKSLLYE